MKITRGGKVLTKGEKCKGLYRLIGKTIYSTKVWKRCAQGNGYPRCESFAAKTKSRFQVANICESVNPVAGKNGSMSFSCDDIGTGYYIHVLAMWIVSSCWTLT